MSTAGRIYDTEELNRIKGWLNKQNEDFVNQESQSDKNEVLKSAAILIAGMVIAIVVLKKLLR